MTENPAASTNDPASLLEAVEKSRSTVRQALTHGQQDVELVVISGFIPMIIGKALEKPSSAVVPLAIGLFLSVGLVLRIRRLHNLGGRIGVPTWIGVGAVVIAATIAAALGDRDTRSWLVGSTYVAVFVMLAAAYRRALLAGMAALIAILVIVIQADVPTWIGISTILLGGAAVLFFGRRQFFGPNAL